MRVVIRGAGELATGVALRLHRARLDVVLCELASPTAIRRAVSMSEAVRKGEMRVENVRGLFCADEASIDRVLSQGDLAVCVDPEGTLAATADVLVDAIRAGRNLGTRKDMAPTVVALGPGFAAGKDCHAVVETRRGPDLGRVYYLEGARASAADDPLDAEILCAPCAGVYEPVRAIGEPVNAGDVLSYVDGRPVRAQAAGILRGQLPAGINALARMQCAEVDPHATLAGCYAVSDWARSLGGAVLEAILAFAPTASPSARDHTV